MKTKPNQRLRNLRAAFCGLLTAGLATTAQAVPDRVISSFDANASGCGTAWGNATGVFDAGQDNSGNGGGALYISGDFAADQNTATVFCNEPPSGAWNFQAPGFNFSDYTHLEFDVKWDTTKTLSIADFNSPPLGGEGGFVIWATDLPGFNDRPTLGNISIPAGAATGWAHVSLPINGSIPNIDPSVGIVFKKWISGEQRTAGGTYGLWIDNVTLKGTDGPPPPPTVSLTKTVPGLGMISASGGEYDRQNIVTAGNNYSWIGASGPVSYAVEVAKLADNDHPNYELHFFFVPGTPDTTRSDPDWHEATVLRWDIGNNATGGGYSTLRYKTNAVDGNGIYYAEGQLGGPGSASAVGTWTITFNNDTNLTATTPDGTTFSTNLPPDVAAMFANPLKFYVGVMPGNASRVGQMAVVTRIQTTGTPGAANLDSQFIDIPLNTSDWTTNAASNIGITEISTNSAFWLDWTLPAGGFSPQIGGNLAGPWASPTLTGFAGGGAYHALVMKSNLPAGNAAFFRLIKRTFTKLQVLLPGESNAPDTVTGKTGTPTAITAGSIINVTVNAVDDTFHVVDSSDTVQLVGSDASILPDGNIGLNGGTGSVGVFFQNAGSFTITASDLTDPSKTANTSSSITVNP